jgi:hypothetical protein
MEPCTFCMACDRAYTESAKGKKAAALAERGAALLPLSAL